MRGYTDFKEGESVLFVHNGLLVEGKVVGIYHPDEGSSLPPEATVEFVSREVVPVYASTIRRIGG